MQTVPTKPETVSAPVVIRGLSYSYRGFEVFREFSLESDSRTVVLRGSSGCGKTTLLKLLSGNLMPDSVANMPEPSASCLVLQEDSLLPWLTGIDNISKFARIASQEFSSHPMFGLISPFVQKKACQMSYGQRRMVELFRAIIFQPKYLYLDEPFNFLDERNMGFVLPFLQEHYIQDTTLVLSNHHRDHGDMIKSASIFRFDGQFPITSLERVN